MTMVRPLLAPALVALALGSLSTGCASSQAREAAARDPIRMKKQLAGAMIGRHAWAAAVDAGATVPRALE